MIYVLLTLFIEQIKQKEMHAKIKRTQPCLMNKSACLCTEIHDKSSCFVLPCFLMLILEQEQVFCGCKQCWKGSCI